MIEGPRRPRTIDFTDESKTYVKVRDLTFEIEHSPWGSIEEYGVEGVYSLAWKLKDVDETVMDGALITIESGCRTLIQHVVSETTFCEVPQTGILTFLAVDPEGNLHIHHFDSQEEDASSYMMEVKKGWTMCWFASKNQIIPAHVLELREPGFKTSELATVEFGVAEFNGHPIPPKLWETIKRLMEEDYDPKLLWDWVRKS
ncbi:MAG TPA: hypothetical protein VMX76_00360 [Nevskiaceae bacterium]|nr:hypothetical protein [Nevskiaceae bacterium]